MKDWMKYLLSSKKILNPSPSFYEIYLTNRCNLNCPWCCTKESRTKDPRDMRTKLVYQIIDKAYRRNIGVSFTGGGEPTLHPNFKEIITYARKCIGVGLVSNGTYSDQIREYLEIMKGHNNYWVRLSLNDRPLNKRLEQLFRDYPGKIGISIVSIAANYSNISFPAEDLKRYAKFIRRKTPSDETPNLMDPEDCVGRKYERVYEPDGTVAWCCHSLGAKGKPPKHCFDDCRWSKVHLDEVWKENPWT